MYHFIMQLLLGSWTLTWAVATRIWSSLPSLLPLRRPPDRQAQRRRRYQETLLYHTRRTRPRSSRAPRMLAAAMALAHLTSADAGAMPRAVHLATVIRPSPPPSLRRRCLHAMTLLLHSTEQECEPDLVSCPASYDSDSALIGVDNRATACLTDLKSDVVPGTLRRTNTRVKVFGGIYSGEVYRCTIRWDFLDHRGRRHTFTLPNSYYIPEGGMRLLSPQHWSQELMKQSIRNRKRPPRLITDNKQMTLLWDNHESSLTVDLDERSNVANIHQAPGYNKYRHFLQAAGMENEDEDPIAMDATIVSDDEQSQDNNHAD